MRMPPLVVVSARGEQRIHSGHPWIYRADVMEVAAEGGDLVEVVGPRRRTLGHALFSDRSQITLRMLTHGEAGAGPDVIRTRLARALAFRQVLGIDADAYRLVHGMDRLLPDIVTMLVELVGPRGILARNDPKVRTLEGLEQVVDLLHGSVPESVTVREGPVEYDVDLRRGQKTGLFLDQRENREAAARYARGRLLDGFSYQGAFALSLAKQCDTVEALDISTAAVEQLRANAIRNQVSNIEVREVNVFDELRRLERAGARYETIVLDPPAFAKNKASVSNAIAGYKEINLRAMRLLQPGGYLVTCSCSYNVSEALFGDTLRDASADSHVAMAVVEKRMQGRDHPVLLGVPETHYLKCFILRRVE
jgi:23S rRNA (cytosine1962-C5)-methyltransferase